ncbi:MAG: TfoX/Sxy family protein [Betaproteobacteria bacterium]|nr:TfoX/Sxy family protein [Betaproteobacteria bacterium]
MVSASRAARSCRARRRIVATRSGVGQAEGCQVAVWEQRSDPAVGAARLRKMLGKRAGLTEKPMFGGMCFLLNGNILSGTRKQGFMFRVDPADETAAGLPGAEPVAMCGRAMRGFCWAK